MKTALQVVDPDVVCCPPLLDEVISNEEADVAARVFRALGDPARVRLLSMVASAADREACVCDLVPGLDLSQPTVSHHLKVLREAGLLDRERRGSWVYYRLRPDALAAIGKAVAP
ncbi:MAG TPA: metalloregulator ArsR/SmtB family transcription factor [Actinomycetota bacterium]|nr:metalloregulator ArsR/SmtB family transcription factor [Actinomycetota bacterium]